MRWNRKHFVVAVPALVLLVSVVGGLALVRSSDDVDVKLTGPGVVTTPGIGTNAPISDDPFPFTPVVDLETGKQVTLSPGTKPMIINFWFSTCEPCKREMPALREASLAHGDKVTFVGVNPNDTARTARDFLRTHQVTFANYLDDGDQLANAGIVNMPTTVFVNMNGTVAATHAGEITLPDIEATIARLWGAG